jgi:tetratricopeptide (TPR) repeat protein
MSRFGNLEFTDPDEELFQADETVVKDESFFLNEARTAFATADFERALRYFSRSLEYNAQNAAAYSGQVRALIELGEYHEAEKWAAKALEQFPHDPELLAARAVALGRQGELDSALAYSDASVEERGNTPYIWLARADVLLARGESAAEYCFEKALAVARGEWLWHWLAARIRRFYKHFAAAVKLLQEATQRHADEFMLWLELGECQLALGLGGRAQTSFARARELNPSCEAARLGMTAANNQGLGARLKSFWRSFSSR